MTQSNNQIVLIFISLGSKLVDYECLSMCQLTAEDVVFEALHHYFEDYLTSTYGDKAIKFWQKF